MSGPRSYIERNAPGHFDSGGRVVVPFANDDEMRAIIVLLATRPPASDDDLAMLDKVIAHHHPEVRAAWARVRSARPPASGAEEGWRPIESHPRDGNKMLALERLTGTWRIVHANPELDRRLFSHWLRPAPPALGEQANREEGEKG